MIGRRKATGLEQRQPGCLEEGDPVFIFWTGSTGYTQFIRLFGTITILDNGQSNSAGRLLKVVIQRIYSRNSYIFIEKE